MDEKIKGIETVVFDLGGVVIDLDRDASVRALEALGLDDAGAMLDLYRQYGPFLELESGKISSDEFFDLLRPRCHPGTSDRDIREAFCRFLVGLPVERLRYLRRLREAGYQVLALSNTNPVMFHSWIDRAFRVEGFSFYDYFEGIIASFQEGCCKPDAEIFEILIRRYSLEGAHTLYLDDGETNCRAAERAGLRAVHVTPARDMVSIAKRLL